MKGFNMGDLISLLIVFAIYLVAASSGKKKKKKRNPMRSRSQGEQRDARAAQRDEQTRRGFDDAFVKADPAHAMRCGTQPIHLHEVSQRQFAAAKEGEDPCHAGGFNLSDNAMQAESSLDQLDHADGEALAQDVLRGVIMSEILMRPHERAAMRRGRR